MKFHKYLIVGAGIAADSAIKGIRLVEPGADIGVIGDEAEGIYNRPPLSKGLWDGLAVSEIMRPSRTQQAACHFGRRAMSIDPMRKLVRDDRGVLYRYDRLLLATGGSPRKLEGNDAGVVYFRTLADYRRVRAMTDQRMDIAIAGGGLIGTELAASLRKTGVNVSLYCGNDGPGGRLLPPMLQGQLARQLRSRGVDVFEGVSVRRVDVLPTGRTQLSLSDGRTVEAARLVCGIGLRSNVELAQAAGLTIDGGIAVGSDLRTSDASIWAAGDCAAHVVPALGRRVLAQHEEHANFSGLAAGRSMAGAKVAYTALPYFYSSVGDISYEGIGDVDARLAHDMRVRPGASAARVAFLCDGRVVGVLFWNCRSDVDAASSLIESREPYSCERFDRLLGFQ